MALRERLPYLAVVGAAVLADQLTKLLLPRYVPLHEFRPLVSGLLSLSHVRNRGAAFGVLSDAEFAYQGVAFTLVSLVALAAIAVYALRLPAAQRLPQTGLALILGGAAGNLIDRARLGYVLDFIHVYWKQYQWWDFNVADACISVGVGLLLLDAMLSPERQAADHPSLAAQAAGAVGRSEPCSRS